ncbi:MAG: EAL domain-containing protein [Coriobacteriales bacterium]|nr:EAL domain-containing protein [Coriobacteriales bacterium]
MNNGSSGVFVGHHTLNLEMAPGGVIVFYADGDMEILHMNRHAAELLDCDSAQKALDFYTGSFRAVVHEEDQTIVDEFMHLLSRIPNQMSYTYLRVRTAQNRITNVAVHGKYIQPEGGGRAYCNAFIVELMRFRTVDWLTGLPTMNRFYQLAKARVHAYQKQGLQPVVATFDFTGFKNYNDRYGRTQGDESLRRFAELLSDAFGRDACSHFEGDHFFAIGEATTVEDVVSGLLSNYSQAPMSAMLPVRVGLYACEPDDDITTVGFNRAQTACDRERTIWRSHFTWFTDDMHREERIRVHVLESLDTAIAKGWIRPYYQAIARASTNDICGEEALARWIDPQYGFLSPAQFIPVLEQAGISYKLDLHMVDCVLADLCTKQGIGVPIVPVSVNFSVSDLTQIDIANEVARRTDERGIDHTLLIVELTESAASSNPELFRKQVDALREAGFDVWMDDFGSGYSSLNTLQEFDFDLVKLDMGFVHGLEKEHGERAQAVISSILQGVSRMGLDTLAEGVETNEQARFLQNAGCNMLQGYLLCRPTPIEEILKTKSRIPREHHEEAAYWDSVGRANLEDLCEVTSDGEAGVASLAERPMGVVELRGDEWRVLRANDAYRTFLRGMGLVLKEGKRLLANTIDANLFDPEFPEAAARSVASGSWEQIAGNLENGTGYQFYVRHLASSKHANAFAVASVPTLLGNALGGFGDVPVAYSVCHAIFDDAHEQICDVVYAYVNQTYLDWVGAKKEDLIGHSFLEAVDDASERWFPYCYRALVSGEIVHDVVYSPEIGHWLSFTIAPCSVEDYYVFAFTMADTEQREREELTVSLDTSDLIIDIADTFSGEASYNVAMNRLLAALNRIAHAKRVSLIEKREDAWGVAFEWCDEGVEPLIGIMQDMKDVEFDAWERLTATKPLIVSDVTNSEGIDKDVLDQLQARSIMRIMAVPVKSDGESLGYLVVDNYELDEDLDVIRLMESVASFVAARMVNHRLVGELKRNSLHDALTGLLNRRGIDLAINEQMASRPGERYVLVLMDIDDFKTVNDVHGHDVGDEALRTLAQAVVGAFPPDAIVGRNGGDEFLALLYGYGADETRQMVEGLLSRDLSCTLHDKRYHLSMSAGYASYPDQANDLMSAYSKADRALYAVKLTGKSGCLAYSSDMDGQYRTQLGFTPRDIAASVPGAIVVCRLTDDWEILFANNEALRLLECDDFADLMSITGGAFANVMHPDDIERVREGLNTQIGPDGTGDKSFATYRVITKSKAVRNVLGSGRLVEVEGMGNLYYELIVSVDECRQAGACPADEDRA